MEEVDEIVLHTLRQIGCDLGEINSLREFTTEIAIEGVIRCLKLINPSLELSHRVPPNMSAKYQLTSTLASICTDLGYKGEIGYQTFLYSNENDLRKIYLFLLENLPKESEKALDEPLDKTALIIKETGISLTKSLTKSWLPHYCKFGATSDSRVLLKYPAFSVVRFKASPLFCPYNYTGITNKEAYHSYIKKHLQVVTKQIHSRSTLEPSVLEGSTLSYVLQCANEMDEDDLTNVLNKKEISSQKREKITKTINEHLLHALQQQKDIPQRLEDHLSKEKSDCEAQGSRFTHSLELQFTPDKKVNTSLVNIPVAQKDSSEEDMQKKRETEINELQNKVDLLSDQLEKLLSENKTYEVSSQNVLEQVKKEQAKVDELKEQFRVKKCTLSLLPQAESNIKKLQGLIDASTQKLVSLANQWEQHRVPLIEQYRELKEQSSRRVNETQRKLEEIKVMREKIRKLGVEARQKEEIHKHLITAYEKLTKDVSRSSYTRRIMEIVSNIKKQKAEIDKVLLDTRNVQKEINKLSGKLERTFTVTDELIFKDAKKDEAIRRAYKYLASLHENCSGLIMMVEETGTIMREIRELEDQIEQENQKKVTDNLERITSDYKQMQRENETLIAELK